MSGNAVTAEDLCVYGLDLMDAAESKKLEDFLHQSTAARAELERVQGDLALLALTADPLQPSPQLLQRVLREIAREPKAAASAPTHRGTTATVRQPLTPELGQDLLPQDSYTPSTPTSAPLADEAGRRSKRPFYPLLRWAGWVLAAGLAVSTGVLYQRTRGLQARAITAERAAAGMAESWRKSSPQALESRAVVDALRSEGSQHVLLASHDGPASAAAQVAYLPEQGALVLQGSNLQPVPAGKVYALWLRSAQEDSLPVRVATFQPDAHGSASVAVTSMPPGVSAVSFGISLEDENGSGTSPSTVVLAGPE